MKQLIDNLFGKLLLWQKFLILGILAIILVLVPYSFYFTTKSNEIKVADNEINGIQPELALQKLQHATQLHRGLSRILLGGDSGVSAAREEKEKEVTNTFATLDSLFKARVRDGNLNKRFVDVRQQWLAVLGNVKNAKVTSAQTFKEHTDLIVSYFDLMDRVADYFELSLDPAAETYFMMRAAIYETPNVIESLTRSQGTASALLAGKQADIEQVQSLRSLMAITDVYLKTAKDQLDKTFESSPITKDKLQVVADNAYTERAKASQLTTAEVLEKQDYTYDPKSLFDTYTKAVDALLDLNNKSMEQMQALLKIRKKGSQTQLFTVSGGLFLLFTFGALAGYLISKSITGPVTHLVGVMNQLAGGDDKVRANMQTFDEVGMMGRQFDMMVDQRELVSAKVQQENDTMNNSIIDMLQAVGAIAQRDLTIKAPVAEDITGPLGDALNYLTDETAKVLNNVVRIAGEVSDVSKQVKTQSDTVIGIAADEKKEVDQSAVELSVASEEMFNIAKLALACNEAAGKAIKNTDKAQETVLGTVQGITSIRDTIRETEKRIKRLGERSQEIGSVVTIINSIAERTHILALNASMHAASAGEAGRGFAVVANEVQKLAENAREATQQISGLVNNIQVETADTVTNMNDAITQVVRGTTLAQQAGNEMKETRDTTAELVQLVQQIATGAKAQAETAQKLRERAVQIQKSTEQTFQQLQEQGKQTDRLVDFSGNLVESVGVFKLPAVS